VGLLFSSFFVQFLSYFNYGDQEHASKIIRLFEDIFSWLPIATIVDHKILVIHGGVSNTVDLKFLATIDRHKVKISSSWQPLIDVK
jgi:hypothetical protein